MAYKAGIHRFTRSDYDALSAENERLRELLKLAYSWMAPSRAITAKFKGEFKADRDKIKAVLGEQAED